MTKILILHRDDDQISLLSKNSGSQIQLCFIKFENNEILINDLSGRIKGEYPNESFDVIFHHISSNRATSNVYTVELKNEFQNSKIHAYSNAHLEFINTKILFENIEKMIKDEIDYNEFTVALEDANKINADYEFFKQLSNFAESNSLTIDILKPDKSPISISPKYLQISCLYKNFNVYYLSLDFLKLHNISIDQIPEKLLANLFNDNKPIIFTNQYNIFEDESLKGKLDSRMNFFDSSIWCRFLTIEEINSNKESEFTKYSDRCEATSAKEYIEYNKRLFNNSYIANQSNSPNGHAGHIAPFSFHSERHFKKEAEIDEKLVKQITGIKWNILLIDDHAKQNIEGLGKNKKEVIKENLDIIEAFIDIKECKSIDEGIANLVISHYDIILLDYLFIDDKSNKTFGHEMLATILGEGRVHHDNKFQTENLLGPTNKFWIFPISVYGNAMMDKLREKGITAYDDNWVISPGADPLNTPELFKYKFLSFLRRQFEDYGTIYLDKNEHKIISSFYLLLMNCLLKDEANNLLGIMNDFVKKKLVDDYVELKSKIFIHFSDIIFHGAKFRRLNNFKDHSDTFSKAIIKNFYFDFQYVDWDHFQNLIFYLAYGNKSNHNVIINQEINYFRNKLKNNNTLINEYKIEKIDLFKTFIETIQNLIKG